jgi:hypothetical protein
MRMKLGTKPAPGNGGQGLDELLGDDSRYVQSNARVAT